MTKGELWIEKRRHERLELSFSVSYHLLSAGAGVKDDQAQIANMSRGGIRLVTWEDVQVGSTIHLKIFLPDELPPVTGTARTVWRREKGKDEKGRTEYHIGLKFVELESKGQDLVTRFMTENLKKMSGL